MAFTFSAVYFVQGSALFCGFIFVLVYDYVLMEVLTEIIIALLYLFRERGGILLAISQFLNHARTVKTLT